MGKSFPTAALLAALSAPVALAQDFGVWLQQVSDAGHLYQAGGPRGERCVQFSSYDRKSDAGPGDQDAWFANGDCGQYLRVEEHDGHKAHVMVDTDGPGCLVRLWTANPKGSLTFLVDDLPAWTVDFTALVSGKLPGVPEPLAGMHSRGGNCYLPIPFQQHLKITASEGGFYYQCNVRLLGKDRKVESFRSAWLQERAAAITAAAADLGRAPVFPAATLSATAAEAELKVLPGSIVRQLRFRPTAAAGTDLGEALRALLLEVRCGDEVTVSVPVGDFFAGAPDWKPHQGRFLGITKDGTGWCGLPMPMPQGGSVRLVGAARPGLTFGLDVVAEPAAATGEPLRFHASFHQRKQTPTRPFTDHLVLDAKGRGSFVGCTLLVQNPVKAWWGEGDEKFFVDGEKFPSTFGTGTEDYFGYAWCCPDLFSHALHAQVQCDGPGNYGFCCVNRMQVADAVPFEHSFRFDLEVWHWADCRIDYATVAYWYGEPGSSSGLPPVPEPAARTLDRLGPRQVFVAKDALEGESLPVKLCTGGKHEVQALDDDEKFSQGKQRWWLDGKPGDKLGLSLSVPVAGRYRVKAQFCTAVDYGIVQVWIAGEKAGLPIDLYHQGVKASGEKDLGEFHLGVGDADLMLEITGKNDKAVPRYMVGLDYVKLEKVQ